MQGDSAEDSQTFRVVFIGIKPGTQVAEARTKLAALFRATPEQVDRLVLADGYVLKSGISLEVAAKYKVAIESAGGQCIVQAEAAIKPQESMTEPQSRQGASKATPAAQLLPVSEPKQDDVKSDPASTLWARFMRLSVVNKIGVVVFMPLAIFGIGSGVVGLFVEGHSNATGSTRSQTTEARASSPILRAPTVVHCLYRKKVLETYVYLTDGTYVQVMYLPPGSDGEAVPIATGIGEYKADGDMYVHRPLASRPTEAAAKTMGTPFVWEQLQESIEASYRYGLADGKVTQQLVRKVVDGNDTPLDEGPSQCWTENSQEIFAQATSDRRSVPASIMTPSAPAPTVSAKADQRDSASVNPKASAAEAGKLEAQEALARASALLDQAFKSCNPMMLGSPQDQYRQAVSAYRQATQEEQQSGLSHLANNRYAAAKVYADSASVLARQMCMRR